MLCIVICKTLESVGIVKLCVVLMMTSKSSEISCTVVVSERSGKFCSVAIFCCWSGIVFNC